MLPVGGTHLAFPRWGLFPAPSHGWERDRPTGALGLPSPRSQLRSSPASAGVTLSRGRWAGAPAWVFAGHPRAAAAAHTHSLPRRPRARRLEATGAQERTARVAEARKLGAPGQWTHRRPRGVGSARLARGHSRCARRVEDDSASLGSVFPGGRREGPPKFPVTAQMSRAGRGLRQLGPGGSGQRGRGGGGGVLRAPRASPTSFRLAPPSARGPKAPPAQGVGVGVGERVASRPQESLAFPKSRGSAGQEGQSAAVASPPGPESPAPPPAAFARTPRCSALERQRLGSPGPGSGSLGGGPAAAGARARARAPAPPSAPSPLRLRGRGSSRGWPRSSALAGTRGAPSPVPTPLRRARPRPPPRAPAPSSLLPLRPPLPSGESSEASRHETPPPGTRPPSSVPDPHPQLLGPPGSGDGPGASPRVAPAAADCGVVKNSAAAVAGRGRARSAAAKDTGVCESPPARRLPPSRRGPPDSPGPPRRGRAAAEREARLSPSSPRLPASPLPSLPPPRPPPPPAPFSAPQVSPARERQAGRRGAGSPARSPTARSAQLPAAAPVAAAARRREPSMAGPGSQRRASRGASALLAAALLYAALGAVVRSEQQIPLSV